ncbi:putative COP1-interacting protein 7 [Cocos nucifera]|uniref:Putative COP1-interacting protein 7 n=1 Tax=Cocos nucifera TaxID=13894 RepID=A0A8K0IDF0_COCNU|nr:putative COP1-interacting protein 7 [Cocos nucifera]
MKSEVRCDLVIVANGKSEKIASGLLNPFLAHLKTAQDQIAKGGYSITLEPDLKIDAVWFTKGTVERFVRFVSTPEVLERVTTVESEILQIEEAIAIQGNDNLGLSTVEDHQTKPLESIEGSKSTSDADTEKAIVLYKPGSQPHPSDSNGSTTHEENSKVQLLRVLETRKIVLQKEQGMAFARAVAAGFDMDHMAQLISFAESFGASRLILPLYWRHGIISARRNRGRKEACLRFMELWKRKHETGQWVEVEVAEAMSVRSEFSSLNASGIILSGDTRRQKEYGEAWPLSGGDMGTESNGTTDRKILPDPQVPLGPHEYYQGHFQHPTHPPWPMHSLPGPHVFQPYPMQGMPYYQNYPGSGPYFHPPYPPMEDPRFSTPQKMRRHSMDSKDSNIELEASEMGGSGTRSQDGTYQDISEFEKEGSHGRESRKRVGRSGKKKSGMVVIRNINYIASKRHETSGSESESASDTETEEESKDMSDARDRKHGSSSRTSKTDAVHLKSIEFSDAYAKDEVTNGQEADSGNWQAFQSFLLRAEEKLRTADVDILAGEKEPPPVKRKQNNGEDDSILPPQRYSGNVQERRMIGLDSLSGKASRMKQMASNDELLISGEGRGVIDSQLKEIEGGSGGYKSLTSDEFMVYGRDRQVDSKNSSDPLVDQQYEHDKNLDKKSSYNVMDESFVVPFRLGSQDQLGSDGRTGVDIYSEFPPALQRTEDSSSKPKNQITYEPDDLTLLPERRMESVSIGYDPAKDYDIQIPVKNAVEVEIRNHEDVPASTKEELKNSEKDKKLRISQNGSEKKKKDALMRKGTMSKMNPSVEAQKRAEKVRASKADLQKAKKEREEEERKRLEALKRERQQRIAARGGTNATQKPLIPQQTKARIPTKLSPSSYRGSKFNDSEPGSSSPLQKLPTRTTSVGSNDSQKITRTGKLNGSSHGLSRSASSLPEIKKENSNSRPEAKTASIQTRRLSDPRGTKVQRASPLQSVSRDQVPKKGMTDESQKKISAIIQLDKSKSATLPELKIRTSKGPSNTVQNKSAAKETSQKGVGSKTSQALVTTKTKRTDDKTSRLSNIDDNLVIEKTVVMLENEVVSAPAVQASEAMIGIKDRTYGADKIGKTALDSEYAAIHAPPSPIIVGEIENTAERKLDDQLNSYEVVIDYSKEEPQKFSNTTVIEKPYQAPYARTTSLEDPIASNEEYAQVPPVLNSEMATMHSKSIKARVPNFAMGSNFVDHMNESCEKPRSKETKGFRKLLKFGRKSHNSATGEGNQESDASSVDEHTLAAASSNDVHMLKNLISRDDSHAGGTSTKGFPRWRRWFASTPPPSPPRPPKKVSEKADAAKGRKIEAVKSFIQRYMVTHPGVFPKAKEVCDVVGGSFYIVKNILAEMKTKMLPGSLSDNQIASSELHITEEENPETTVIKENSDSGELDMPGKGALLMELLNVTESHSAPDTDTAALSSARSSEDTALFEKEQMEQSVNSLASPKTAGSWQQSHSLSHIAEDKEKSISMHGHEAQLTEATSNGNEEYLTDKKCQESNQNSQATGVNFLRPNQSSPSNDITASDQKVTKLVDLFKRTMKEVGLECRNTDTLKHETSGLRGENKHVIGLVDQFKRNRKDSEDDDIINKKNIKQDKSLNPKEEIREDSERKSEVKGLLNRIIELSKGTHKAGSWADVPNNEIDKEMRGFVDESIKLLSLNDESEYRKSAGQTDREEPREVNTLHSEVRDNTWKSQPSDYNIVNMNLQLNKNGKSMGSPDILESQLLSEASDSDIAAFDYPEPESKDEVALSTQLQNLDAFLKEGTGNYENRLLVKFLLKAAKTKDIGHAFRDCGQINEIRVVRTRIENRYNYAYVCFKTEEGLIKALSKTDVAVCGADVVVEAASPIEFHSRLSNMEPAKHGDFPAAFLQNPTRTVMVKGLPKNTPFYQLKHALSFWGRISGLTMGSTGSSVYVEYESEESKEMALAVATVFVLGKKLMIYRIDAPKTTVVRISRVNHRTGITKIQNICESYGQVKRIIGRDVDTFDVHFKLSEYGNMVEILNRLNGKVVDHHKWVAQPATVIPAEILQTLWSKPQGRKYVHNLIKNLCRKIEEKNIDTSRMLNLAQECYGDG